MTRVRRSLWILVLVSVVATGALTRTIQRSGPDNIVVMVLAGLIAAFGVLLALRILVVLNRNEGSRG